MTNEEALKITNECLKCGGRLPEAESYTFWETIKNALENQIEAEKYKWHDLRKNPDDLPSGDDRNILTKDKLGSYHVFSSLMFCEYRVYTNIICWKEIEPFEEVEK